MNQEEHRQRHVELHASFDELFADWIEHTKLSTYTTQPIIELLEWSHQQTIEPDHESGK